MALTPAQRNTIQMQKMKRENEQRALQKTQPQAPITFGSKFTEALKTDPAYSKPLNFNTTAPLPKTTGSGGITFGLPGITTQKAALSTPSVGPGGTGTPGGLPTSPTKSMGATVQQKSGYTTPGGGFQTGEIKSTDIPSSNFSIAQSSSFASPQGVSNQQSVSGGGRNSDGSWDPNYTPGSEAEAFSSGVDEYTRKKWLENYYKSKGLKFDSKTPESFEDEAQNLLDEQGHEKSLLDYQIRSATAKSERQGASQKAGIDAQLSSSREGVTSAGNELAKTQMKGEIDLNLLELQDDFREKTATLEKMQQAKQQGLLTGREDQIRAQMVAVQEAEEAVLEAENKAEERKDKRRKDSLDIIGLLQKDNALAGLDEATMAEIQSGLEGLPDGLISALTQAATRNVQSAEQKQKFDNQMTALGAFKGLVAEGIQITPQLLFSTSKETGLPAETLYGFNQAAQQVMQDKNLDAATKAGNLEKLGYELDRQARGITNAELEKVDYIASLYRDGASQQEIAMAKRVMGVKDEDDPMYRLDMEKKSLDNQMQSILNRYIEPEKMQELTKGSLEISGMNFDNIIKEAKANGASETEILNLQKLRIETQLKDQERLEKMGPPVENSTYKEVFKLPGMSKYGHGEGARECGEGYNQITDGPKVGNSYASKMATVTKRDRPAVGNGLVIPLAKNGLVVNNATQPGHIETVIEVDNVSGVFKTVSWNRDMEGGETIQTYKLDDMNKKFGNNWGFNDAGLKPKFSEKLNEKRKEVGNSSQYEVMADNIMTPLSGFSMTDIPLTDRPKVAAILTKKKQEAMEKGDLLGMVAASAGGKELDVTSLQSLEKARAVKTQLDDLQAQFSSGSTKIGDIDVQPLWGVVQSANPYEKKAQLIKAQLRAIIPNLARGVYGEVGVLTDNDITNYSQTIANLTSTEDVSKALTELTQKIVVRSIKTKLDTAARGGRDVSAFSDVLIDLDPSLGKQKESRTPFGSWMQNVLQATKPVEPQTGWDLIDVDTPEEILDSFNSR